MEEAKLYNTNTKGGNYKKKSMPQKLCDTCKITNVVKDILIHFIKKL